MRKLRIMEEKAFFSKEKLRKLIWPLVVEQTLAVLVGMIDVVMVSSVGEYAVSGVSLVDNVSVLLIGLFAAMGTGGAVVSGHFLGQKDSGGASRAANQIILFLGVSSAIVTVAYLLLKNFILNVVFGQIDADVKSAAEIYLIITALSVPGIAIYNGCAALFRAMGNSRVTMWVSLIMNAVNVLGNALLIFVFKMGAAGVAIPTTFSRYLAAIIILVLLFKSRGMIRLDSSFTFKFDKYLIKKILFIGVPSGLENSIFQLGKILILSLASACGTYAIAANAVANTLATVNVIPGNAIGLAILSVASVCVGAADFDQAKYYTKKLMMQIHVYMGVISLILFVFGRYIIMIFNLSDKAADTAVILVSMHAICGALIWPESFSLPNALRAANDVKFTMGIAIFSMWVFRIGASVLFVKVFDMSIIGVWIAMIIDWIFRGIVFVIRYRRGKWMELGRE